jgi:hypothetical protein
MGFFKHHTKVISHFAALMDKRIGQKWLGSELRQAKFSRTLQCFSVLRGSIDDRQLAMTMNKKLQHLNTIFSQGVLTLWWRKSHN